MLLLWFFDCSQLEGETKIIFNQFLKLIAKIYPDILCPHRWALLLPSINFDAPLCGRERVELSISIFLKRSFLLKSFLICSLIPFILSKLKESESFSTSSQKFLINICIWWFVTSIWKFLSVASWFLNFILTKLED